MKIKKHLFKRNIHSSINLLIVFLISSLHSYAQFEDLPSVTPASPEAYEMARAANIPIDQSTGQMSYTIPIHTIDIQGNKWPIALQYNYAGFIPEAKPSLNGWGWSLNAFGSITREVRGIPDFKPKGYYGGFATQLSDTENLINEYVDTSLRDSIYKMSHHQFNDFYTGVLDSELD